MEIDPTSLPHLSTQLRDLNNSKNTEKSRDDSVVDRNDSANDQTTVDENRHGNKDSNLSTKSCKNGKYCRKRERRRSKKIKKKTFSSLGDDTSPLGAVSSPKLTRYEYSCS